MEGIVHAKFQASMSSSFLEKIKNIILRSKRFCEKMTKNEKCYFLNLYLQQVFQTYLISSSTPNTSFYQFKRVFIQQFSFYDTKTIPK